MMQEYLSEIGKMFNKQPTNDEILRPIFKALANNVAKHKKRLGGTFVVAQAIPNRYSRDCIKEVLGADCICVVLRLAKEANAKRVQARHAYNDDGRTKRQIEFLSGIYDLYEDTQPGEENCVTIYVGTDDTKEDVVNMILRKIEEFGFTIEI